MKVGEGVDRVKSRMKKQSSNKGTERGCRPSLRDLKKLILKNVLAIKEDILVNACLLRVR